jgi:hypothetical protein
VRLTEHESERNNEKFVAEIIVDVQDPVAPILEAPCLDETPDDAGGVIARFGEVIYRGTATINQHLLRVGAMEIELGHVRPPFTSVAEMSSSPASSTSSQRQETATP